MEAPTNGSHLARRPTVMGSLAERYQMDPVKLLDTLRATCIKGNATNEQVQAFCIVAQKYGLDPFLKEIHAFAAQGGGIVPIVGIDGWSKIANSTGRMNGVSFAFDGSGPDMSCTCTIYVKDRERPTEITEYLSECKRNTPPWNQYPRRMLRHRAFIQCVRLAFGLGGIYDEDEARDVLRNAEAGNTPHAGTDTDARLAAARQRLEHSQLPDEEIAGRIQQEVTQDEPPAPDDPDVSDVIDEAPPEESPVDEISWPAKIPDEARKSSAWIDDCILRNKPASMTRRQAASLVHALHKPHSWEALAADKQDSLYEAVMTGEAFGAKV
jgi:hypothetical protein